MLTDNYYKTKVYTTLYKDYPFSGAASIKIKDRDVSEYGFPPVKALYHDPEYQLDPTRMPYIDGLVVMFRKDFQDIECQMVNQYCNGKTSLFQTYPQFFHSFPEPPLQNVEQVEFSYVMPGNQVGSKAVINYKR